MLLETLFYALQRKRPHEGIGEEQLARWVEWHFKGQTRRDAVNNIHLDLRGENGFVPSRTLFVAHLDTVHRSDGRNKIQRVGPLVKATPNSPLGADDGAGVAILCYLASEGVPGYYVFTRGEEVGGVGASHLADNNPALLAQFDRAIAFDRRGTDSIITHQWSGKCASNEFAAALAEGLTGETLWYLADDTGVYTDTAEFTGIIPECTNISVGYDHEHSDKEQLDLRHFMALANAARNLDWEDLPVVRDPNEVEEQIFSSFNAKWDKGNFEDDRLNEVHERWDILDALEYAENGHFNALRSLIADAIYPEDPALARYGLRDFEVSPQVIDEAVDRLDCDTPHGVLMWLYDEHAMTV